MDKNDKTMEFSPLNDERKEKINRNYDSVYNNARKSSYENKKNYSDKSSDSKGLVYAVIALLVALIIAVVVGVIIIKGPGKQTPDIIDEPIIMEEEIEEEEEEEPIKEEGKYNIIFYGETVKKTSDGYEIAADMYDESFEKVGSRKIKITDETVIRESGKRMTAEGFVYTIESLTGEMISIEGKIREKDNFAILLSYDGSFREEMTVETPEENEINEIPEENNQNTGNLQQDDSSQSSEEPPEVQETVN